VREAAAQKGICRVAGAKAEPDVVVNRTRVGEVEEYIRNRRGVQLRHRTRFPGGLANRGHAGTRMRTE